MEMSGQLYALAVLPPARTQSSYVSESISPSAALNIQRTIPKFSVLDLNEFCIWYCMHFCTMRYLCEKNKQFRFELRVKYGMYLIITNQNLGRSTTVRFRCRKKKKIIEVCWGVRKRHPTCPFCSPFMHFVTDSCNRSHNRPPPDHCHVNRQSCHFLVNVSANS